MVSPAAYIQKGFSTGLKEMSKHGADAAVTFCLLAIFAYGLYQKYSEWTLLVIVVVIGGGWHIRQLSAERHKERMARLAINQIEAARGRPLRAKHRARLSAKKKRS
jgi:hypothetical protein